MGCDIHLVVERRVEEKWERVEALPPRPCSWCDGAGYYKHRPTESCYPCKGTGSQTEPYHDRNYSVFAILADVRNDGNIKPIDQPRGLPADATKSDDEYEYGDHSFSWLTLAELRAYDWKALRVFDDADRFLSFTETLSSLGKPEDVRIVFGFDS